jgi:hypothetical protein
VFDNDGTLWAEQPIYVQLAFALDRVRALSSQHPEWRHEQPFRAVLDGDLKNLLAGGEDALTRLVMATHAGMTTDEFAATVLQWIETAKHPQTGRRYIDMVYQPMLELLAYLRANGFKTFIVSGGGIEFMRPWAERVYGVPPEQVIGSSIVTSFEMRDGVPVLVRNPAMNFVDDKAGKPVGINQQMGRRGRLRRSATPTATSRCCNGRRQAPVPALRSSCAAPTPGESGPTTASPRSAAWTTPG